VLSRSQHDHAWAWTGFPSFSRLGPERGALSPAPLSPFSLVTILE